MAETNKEKLSLFQRLSAVQNELIAPKERNNTFGKYNYRSCEDILQAVKPLLNEYGLILTLSDEIVEISGRFYVKAIAGIGRVEDNGDGLRVTAYARETETKSGMDAAQITGAASSYARKYALNGLFCIDDTKDADTDEYTTESTERAKKTVGRKPKAETKPAPDAAKHAAEIINNAAISGVKCNDCGKIITDAETEKGKFSAASIIASSTKSFGFACCMDCWRIRAAELKAKREKENGGN